MATGRSAAVRAAGQTRARPRREGEQAPAERRQQRLQAKFGAISMTMQLYYRALAVQIAQGGKPHVGACVRRLH
jgi:hypothetical protein